MRKVAPEKVQVEVAPVRPASASGPEVTGRALEAP